MKILFALLVATWMSLALMPVSAQEPTPIPVASDNLPERFSSGSQMLLRVNVESLVVRAFPTEDAEHIASLFDGDILQAVSRNQDASWFEVRRLGRMNSLGWVFSEFLEWSLLPEQLPLGDASVNVAGPVPLNTLPILGVYLEEAPILREIPLRDGRRIMALPSMIVVPVLARNQDASWLQVNYFGYQGWIHRSTIRERGDVDWMTLPVPPGLPPPDTIAVIIIPIELQQAQIDRLRSFAHERRALAASLESFWWRVYRGEIMPCNAPPEITDYPYTEADIRDLPELGRYIPRLYTAIEYLQSARAPFVDCGVVAPSVTVAARNSAINGRVVFDAVLGAIDALEDTIYEYR